MWRILLAGLVFSLSLSALADEPQVDLKKPQYERMLKGGDAKRAAELKAKFKKLVEADVDEAIKIANELLALRTRLQGADHWEVRDAELLLADTKRPLSADEQTRLSEALVLAKQAATFREKGQIREAVTTAEKALRTFREVLGGLS